MKANDKIPTLFVFNRTPIKVRPGFWIMVLGLWALLSWVGSWRWPEQTLVAYGIVGFVAALLALLADLGHACAHTISARMANAPMDTILLGADMPRTLYQDIEVLPQTHIIRSLGGPVYSAIGFITGIGWLLLAPSNTAVRYLGEVWTLTNGGIFMAIFVPLQIVDGGVILKWWLVLKGRSETQAARIVQRLGLGLGVVLLAVALFFLVQTTWLLGGIFLIFGLVVITVALNIIR